jgi:hypothetical protein
MPCLHRVQIWADRECLFLQRHPARPAPSQADHHRRPSNMTTVPLVSAHPLVPPHARRAQGTLRDFDLGDREDGLGGDDLHAEDTFNVRGDHSEHPEHDLRRSGQASGTIPYMRHVRRITVEMCAYILVSLTFILSKSIHIDTRPSSPTAHECLTTITSQLVELGFSLENGFDVQAATELSLSQACQKGSTHPPKRELRRNADRESEGVEQPVRHQLAIDSHVRPTNPSQSHPQSQPQCHRERAGAVMACSAMPTCSGKKGRRDVRGEGCNCQCCERCTRDA